MVTRSKKRKFTGAKKRFIGKATGQIQERVQAVGPEHFGIVSVDCAKRRSKWILCNFYGKVLIEPTTVEHTAGGLRWMTQLVAETCRSEELTDSIVAVEMTGIYHTTWLVRREIKGLQAIGVDEIQWRSPVPVLTPGNAGRAKGPQFKVNARRSAGPGGGTGRRKSRQPIGPT